MSSSGMKDVQERAELLAEELVDILLRLSSAGREFEGTVADQSLRQALSELSEFRGREDADEEWVGHLRKAQALLKSSIDQVAIATVRESLQDAEAFLVALQSSAIDQVVESDAAGRAPQSLRRIADFDVFLASNGTPACQSGIPVAAPRFFGAPEREPDPAEDDPENEDNDDHKSVVTAIRREHPGKSSGGTQRERMMLETLAREAMEDIGPFSMLRRCFDHEAWITAEEFEKRLLACFDALTSTARPVVEGRAKLNLAEALYGYATEWSFPDRGRAFTFAFVLACLPSDTALLWVEMGLKTADPQVYPSYVEALSLGKSAAINDRLRGLLGGDVRRELMVVALHTAIRRRYFQAGAMLPLLTHPDPTVAELATLATCNAKSSMMLEALNGRDAETRPLVRATQGLVLALHGESRGRMILKELAPRALAMRDEATARRVLRGLSIIGNPTDHEEVWKLAELTKHYRDVGFFGHAPHVHDLFAVIKVLDKRLLEDNEPGLVELLQGYADDAALAIHRISGITVPRFGSKRLDVETAEPLVLAWQPALAGRLRRNAAFNRLSVVDELLHPQTVQGEREILADELTLHSAGEARFDVNDWVADQRSFLKMVREAWNH